MKLTGISVGELQLFLVLLKVSDEIEKEELQALYDYMVERNMDEISGEYIEGGLFLIDQTFPTSQLKQVTTSLLFHLVDKEDYGSIQVNQQGIFKFLYWWNKELHVTIGDE